MSGDGAPYHEPASELSQETRDVHRALVSLIEELEAVDWYMQRVEMCGDAQLASILRHNMEQEMEHAMLCFEWLRRRLPRLDEMASSILHSEGPISSREGRTDHGATKAQAAARGSGLLRDR